MKSLISKFICLICFRRIRFCWISIRSKSILLQSKDGKIILKFMQRFKNLTFSIKQKFLICVLACNIVRGTTLWFRSWYFDIRWSSSFIVYNRITVLLFLLNCIDWYGDRKQLSINYLYAKHKCNNRFRLLTFSN